jgi:hypothetical protein
MTKKDYILLANCINATRRYMTDKRFTLDADEVLRILETHMAAELYDKNTRFNAEKWYAACRA